MDNKNKTTAGILGILLGAYGAHHFYLGDTGRGVLCLLLSLLTWICLPVFAIIGLIEGIRFLSMSDDDFNAYCKKIKTSKKESSATSVVINKYELLLEYKSLVENGTITEEEFNMIKSKILRCEA